VALVIVKCNEAQYSANLLIPVPLPRRTLQRCRYFTPQSIMTGR